jgi:uncharacterized protein YecE (DUF72 family)
MAQGKSGAVRIGVGGWTYAPWRGAFYPGDLAQKRELEYASGRLTSIEINGTYYGSQKPDSFAKWHDETPDVYVFSVKGPRFATNRRVLCDAGESVARFFASGVTRLGAKLGPINWQFLPTKQFDHDDFAAFLDLLPKEFDGRPIRHVVEVRHDSFRVPAFIDLLRAHGVAAVMADGGGHPQIADITAPFVYARLQGTTEAVETGYDAKALDLWAGRARRWAAGEDVAELDHAGAPAKAAGARDVFLYVISGFKQRNPAAAMELIARLN